MKCVRLVLSVRNVFTGMSSNRIILVRDVGNL